MHQIELVYPVFVIWLVAGIACWVLILGAMLPPTGLKFAELKGRDKRTRHAVRCAMDTRLFWVGYWGSFAALVVNTLAPLGLIGTIPLWSLLGVFALNAAGNLMAIPFRLWIWRIHTDSLMTNH